MRTTLKVTAIAAAAAFAINSPAMAEVKVYGKAHLSIDSISGVAAPADGLHVSSHASRVGFKADNDFGNGMTGFVTMEYEIDMATTVSANDGIIKNRTNIAGVKGGFGKAYVGTADMPHKKVISKADQFADTYGDFNAIVGPDTRQSDVVYYENKFGDVGVKLAYAPQYDGTANNNLGASVDFKAGPVVIAVAYEKDDSWTDATTGARVTWKAGFGDLHLVYNKDGEAGGNTQYFASGKFKMGNDLALKAQYGKDDDAGTDLMAAGVEKKFAKKSSAYLLYATGDLKGLGTDTSAISLGYIQKF